MPCRPDDRLGVFTGLTTLQDFEATFRGDSAQNREIEQQSGVRRKAIEIGTVATSTEDALRNAERTLALSVLAFVKPFESTLVDSDPRYYYSEREWRKHGNLVFEPQDVVRVLVEPAFLTRARNELPSFRERIFPAPAPDAG